MLVAPSYQIGVYNGPMLPGDIPNFNEQTNAIDGTGSFTFAVKEIVSGDGFISGGAAVNGTLPTADQIIAGLKGSLNIVTPPANNLYGTLPQQVVQLAWPANLAPFAPGATFRRTYANNNSNTVTMVTAAGITLTAPTTIITVNWREYLFTILNSSPSTLLGATTTNTTKTLTNVDLTAINNVTPGMLATGMGLGAAPNAVTAVNRDTGVISLNVASTASADNIAVTFTPSMTVRGMKSGTV